MTARVLVTGASGQLAPSVIAALTAHGLIAVPLVRNRAGCGDETTPIVLPAPWTREALAQLITDCGIDAVVNLVAEGVRPGARSDALFDTNIALPVRLLMAGAGRVRAFVNIGSGAEYAGGPGHLDEAAPLGSSHAYGLSKSASGLASKMIADSNAIAFAHLRLFGVFGENEAPHRLLPAIVASLSDGKDVPLSDGLQVRDWLYEPDVAAAIALSVVHLLDGTLPPGFFNLGSGHGRTVREFAETVADILGAPRSALRFGAIGRRNTEQDRLVSDPRRFCSLTGWQPRYDLATGLDTAISRLQHERATAACNPITGAFS